MSQNWHGHWIEENYKSTRLGNWEVPKWYPQWPDRHCKKTSFQCDNKGNLLANVKKTNHGQEHFKSAWELPRKIDRRVAQELSAPPKYKKQLWEKHKAFHRAACGESSKKEIKSEKNLTERSSSQKDIRPELFKSSKPSPEAKEMLTQQSPALKTDSKDQNENSKSVELNPELKTLESEENFDSLCTDKQVKEVECLLHQTCKI